MRFLLFVLILVGGVFLRGMSLPGAFLLALFAVIFFSIVLRVVRRELAKLPNPRQIRRRRAPAITNGDIGPYLTWALEQGDSEAVYQTITTYVPGYWRARQGILMLAEEHCRLQRSIRIATAAGVPMPDDTAAFSKQQTAMIADRARRMAFINQHGMMNPRIEASLDRLARGADSLALQSSALRAELAESTAQPQWGAEEEREIRRKLERMTNTLRAMSSDLLADDFDRLPGATASTTRLGSGD